MGAVKLLLLLSFLPSLFGQPVPAKAKVEEYPVHAAAATAAIGAELMVHVVSADGQSHFVRDYMTVELAVYPLGDQTLDVAVSNFTLRINGKKQALLAQSPGFVAASLKYPEFSQRPSLSASAGTGDLGGVTIGGQRPQQRFPGDERSSGQPLPSAAPGTLQGPPREHTMTAAEAVEAAGLAEGKTRTPVAGYLYFPYQGDGRKAKKVELIYRGPAGEITLPLR
jgi:hypothetical protein